MIYESELKVLNVLWEQGDTTARDLGQVLSNEVGWSKSTSYTVTKRCIKKGLVKRLGHDFTCRALITKEEAQNQEAILLVNRLFEGSSDLLIASLLGGSKKIDPDQLRKLQRMVQVFRD